MNRNQWKVEPLVEVEEVCGADAVIDGSYDHRQIDTGYRWDSYDDSGNDDSGMKIVFDQVENRVYITITRW